MRSPSSTAPLAKAALRRRMQAARAGLPPEARRAASEAAAHHLSASGLIGPGVVALYAAFPDEADPRSLEAALAGRTAFPRVTPEGLVFHLAPRSALSPRGRWQILEPPPDAPRVTPDVFVVPGLAFTRAGARLGYGAGYYDRALAAAPDATARIGFTLSMQVVDTLPVEAHDVRMTHLVTDAGLVDCGHPR